MPYRPDLHYPTTTQLPNRLQIFQSDKKTNMFMPMLFFILICWFYSNTIGWVQHSFLSFFSSGLAVNAQRHGPLPYDTQWDQNRSAAISELRQQPTWKLVKKDWSPCDNATNKTTKEPNRKKASHTSPSQKCVSPERDTPNRAGTQRKKSQPRWHCKKSIDFCLTDDCLL